LSYSVKDERELKALLKPVRKAVLEKDLPSGLEMIEKLEKRLARLEKLYSMDHNLLFAKLIELEELKNRLRQLERE
jgi:predicted RNase H-like nuclease (RuvC/YqgF family)